jgi:protein gp37
MLPLNWSIGWDHWPGVWLGATVENRAAADRIGHLQAVSAEVRFLSCEPLLEAIEPNLDGISWVICGGESGGNARTMEAEWARRLRDQCAERGTAFFLKQMTRKAPIPDDLMVRQFPG